MDYDRTPNWNDLNTQFSLGMAQRGETIARRRAKEAQEDAESWREETLTLRRKFVELSKNAHLTVQNRDAWAATARQLWKLVYPNKPEDEVREVMRFHLGRIKRDFPYTGVELSWWDRG